MPINSEAREKIRQAMLRRYENLRGGAVPEARYGDSLRGYGYAAMCNDGFKCCYCGYDGTAFDNWLQLTVDHVKPSHLGGTWEKDNLVTVCHACNSITSRMKFPEGMSREEIIAAKKQRVANRRAAYREFWLAKVTNPGQMPG